MESRFKLDLAELDLELMAHIKEVLYSAVIADVLDDLGYRRQTLGPDVVGLARDSKLFGRALTVRATEVSDIPERPYERELEAVDTLGPGEVFVATIEAQPCGFWGELLSVAAMTKGAVGAVIDGYARDGERIAELDFPVFARGSHPADSKGRSDVIEVGEPIECDGVTVHRGDLVFADIDGVVFVPHAVAAGVVSAAFEKVSQEGEMRAALEDGMGVIEAYDRFGIL